MDWYVEEEYYDDHSEFDAQIDEFKESLKKAVKQEHIDEMNRIKKENEELQEVKKNFESIKQDYARKEQELNRERNNLLSTVRKERLEELFKGRKPIAYKVRMTVAKIPKCNRCDDYRRIHFKSPLGNYMTERCICDKGKQLYKPETLVISEFSLGRHELSVFYKPFDWSDTDGMTIDHDASSTHSSNVYKEGEDFSKLKRYETVFMNEEDCLKYCEYLQEKEDSKVNQ